MRWSFQTWKLFQCNFRLHKERIKLRLKDFDIFPHKNGFIFIFDISKVKSGNLKIRYRVGADDKNGKGMINSDLSDYYFLN